MNNILIIISMSSGVISFMMIRKHMLMCLISLELMILMLSFCLVLITLNFNYEYFLIMIFLTISVCESVLGLVVLIFLIRSHGNDYVSSMSLW